MALRGYCFYGTGAAGGGAATILNVMTAAAITEIPASQVATDQMKAVHVRGVTLVSDTLGLGIRATVKIGSSAAPRYAFDCYPHLDGDLATQPTSVNVYEDLGDFEVGQKNAISITLYDPGAAALMAGVLWIDDGEEPIKVPSNYRSVTLRMGTNDGGTTLSATGAETPDLTSRPLSPECIYYVIGARVTPEDKIIQAAVLQGEGDHKAVAPPAGTVHFPEPMASFRGTTTPTGLLQVQAATKIQCIWYLAEVPANMQVAQASGVQSSGVILSPFPGTAQGAQRQIVLGTGGSSAGYSGGIML